MIDMNKAATKTTPTATFWLIRDSTTPSIGDPARVTLPRPRLQGHPTGRKFRFRHKTDADVRVTITGPFVEGKPDESSAGDQKRLTRRGA
jgi:hypothetical protein